MRARAWFDMKTERFIIRIVWEMWAWFPSVRMRQLLRGDHAPAVGAVRMPQLLRGDHAPASGAGRMPQLLRGDHAPAPGAVRMPQLLRGAHASAAGADRIPQLLRGDHTRTWNKIQDTEVLYTQMLYFPCIQEEWRFKYLYNE